jgi:transcriptional regulator with XRE-family HTH domain
MLEKNISQKDLAASLDMIPQAFSKLLSKKNFSFEDAKKILNALGYDLSIEFIKK